MRPCWLVIFAALPLSACECECNGPPDAPIPESQAQASNEPTMDAGPRRPSGDSLAYCIATAVSPDLDRIAEPGLSAEAMLQSMFAARDSCEAEWGR